MREILCRGKRKDNGEWVYGDLVKHYENQRRFIACDQLAFTYSECGIDRLVTERFYEVIPETVGQYAGMKDKNGVEIYEGDIVSNGVFRATVEYLNDLAGYYPFASEIKSFYPPECEVIGNIHDNPELDGLAEDKK